MSFFTPYQQTVAVAFALGSLGLSPLISYFNRNLSHSLFIVQMVYLFNNVYATNITLYANRVGLSWLGFIPSFLTYCSDASYDCNNASLLTALIGWIALVILLAIIVRIIRIKKPNATFKPVYNFFKGFFRCIIIPLFYNSMVTLQIGLINQEYHRDYYFSLGVLIIFGIIGLVELIYYKCQEQKDQNTWIKWTQLWNQIKVVCCVTMVSVSFTKNQIAKYILYAPIILYDIFHLIKYDFTFKVFQRFIFILQQCTFITIYTLFLFDVPHINQYNLDFMAIALTILLELILFFVKIYAHCKSNGIKQGAVKNDMDTPSIQEVANEAQDNKKTLTKQKSSTKLAPIKKQNSFLADINLDDNSYAQLNGSISSPRKGNRGK